MCNRLHFFQQFIAVSFMSDNNSYGTNAIADKD